MIRLRYRRHPTAETIGLGLVFLIALVGSTVYFTRDREDVADPPAEARWEAVHSGIGSTLLDVEFLDRSHGWAVGQEGRIVATTDGGASWQAQDSGFEVTLRSVDFVDELTGWAVGHIGLILRTADGGQTWELFVMEEALGQDLIEVSFNDPMHGWIIAGSGGLILQTSDGGATWVRRPLGNTQSRSAAFILDSSRAWLALRTGGLLSTADRGESWSLERGVNEVEIGTSGVYFLDERRGWVAGWRGKQRGLSSGVQLVKYLTDGMVAYTTDGGVSWTRVDSDTGRFLWDVEFPTLTEGWAVGSSGLVMRSTDAGLSWETYPSGTEAGLRALTFVTPNRGWAVGEGGTVLKFRRE